MEGRKDCEVSADEEGKWEGEGRLEVEVGPVVVADCYFIKGGRSPAVSQVAREGHRAWRRLQSWRGWGIEAKVQPLSLTSHID